MEKNKGQIICYGKKADCENAPAIKEIEKMGYTVVYKETRKPTEEELDRPFLSDGTTLREAMRLFRKKNAEIKKAAKRLIKEVKEEEKRAREIDFPLNVPLKQILKEGLITRKRS